MDKGSKVHIISLSEYTDKEFHFSINFLPVTLRYDSFHHDIEDLMTDLKKVGCIIEFCSTVLKEEKPQVCSIHPEILMDRGRDSNHRCFEYFNRFGKELFVLHTKRKYLSRFYSSLDARMTRLTKGDGSFKEVIIESWEYRSRYHFDKVHECLLKQGILGSNSYLRPNRSDIEKLIVNLKKQANGHK